MNSPKLIAMYLPQFHRVLENDTWWGAGFTEWTTVKLAEKLFEEHEQPRVPLNNNYYDLLDKNTMQWQCDLLHKFNLDGMCFYHYYFKNGRKILEQPAENLLAWQDIDMPFCFSWANESWIRSWSRLSENEGNPWSAKFDKAAEKLNDNDGILIQQDYGEVEDWIRHYQYLSKFFHDRRYIKYEGMPVFIIYKPSNIPCLKQMLEKWDELAKFDGFPGVYSIGTNVQAVEQYGLKGINLQEPQDTITRFYPNKFDNDDGVMRSMDYQEVWDRIITKQVPKGASLGVFVGYDDTPRRGHGGSVIRYRNPFAFYEGVKKLLVKANREQSPFVFINAWNEWGEGMYLEPDENYGTCFLEALKQARIDASRMISKCNEVEVSNNNILTLQAENQSLIKTIDRYRDYWRILDLWVGMLERGKTIADYLINKGFQKVAIYGYGMLGKHLVYQLNKEDFQVNYVIERQKEKKIIGVSLYSLDDKLPYVDAIVVTVLYDYDKIEKILKEKLDCYVLPIDKIFEINILDR